MGSLMSRITRMARGPQGKQMMDRAQRMARDPETRRKINEARGRVGKRLSGPPR